MPKAPPPPRPKFTVRVALRIAAWMLILTGLAWGAIETQSFLAHDPHFVLDTFEIRGVTYASRSRIQGVFAADFGHSIFQIPLPERRRHLLAVDWVRTASI